MTEDQINVKLPSGQGLAASSRNGGGRGGGGALLEQPGAPGWEIFRRSREVSLWMSFWLLLLIRSVSIPGAKQ